MRGPPPEWPTVRTLRRWAGGAVQAPEAVRAARPHIATGGAADRRLGHMGSWWQGVIAGAATSEGA